MMKKIVPKLRSRIRRLRNTVKIRNRKVSLITQDCIGGVLSHDFMLPFRSPTINLFIEGENFVKLVENLRHYLSVPAEPYLDEYVDPIDPSVRYPKIRVDDIEICCMHYGSCDEAVEAWERRRKRVDFDNIRVIANSSNLKENEDLIRRICNTGYKTICFTYGDRGIRNCIPLTEDFWKPDRRGILRPDLTDYDAASGKRYYEKYVDFAKWINSRF